jgi:hypothetical protein
MRTIWEQSIYHEGSRLPRQSASVICSCKISINQTSSYLTRRQGNAVRTPQQGGIQISLILRRKKETRKGPKSIMHYRIRLL